MALNWDTVFAAGSAKLSSRDVIEQGDAGVEIFQAWYSQAAAYAKGNLAQEDIIHGTSVCLNYLMAESKPNYLSSGTADDYAVRALMENYRKICGIFVSKPKFHSLLAVPLGGPVLQTIQRHSAVLADAAGRSGVPSGSRNEYVLTLIAILDLGSALAGSVPELYPRPPFTVNLSAVLPLAVATSGDANLRSTALDLLKTLRKVEGDVVMHSLAGSARDQIALQALWEMGAIRDKICLETLITRVRQTSASASTNSHSGLPPFPLEVVSSIAAVIMSDAIDARDDCDSVVTLLRECDAVKSSYKEDEQERSSELIQLLGMMTADVPDNPRLIELCCTPLTIESLHMLSGHTDLYPVHIWMDILLPLLEEEIGKMSLQGVSGEQLEQEVINFLRDGARVFYINRDIQPTLALGHRLLLCIVQAMRRGYVETERFAELAGMIIEAHLTEGSAEWIPFVLSDDVCGNHKTTRAMLEIISRLLGVEPFNDLSTPISAEQQQTVLDALASTPTAAAFQYIIDLCRNNGLFVQDQEPVICRLIMSIDYAIGVMATQRSVDTPFLATIVELCTLLSFRITPNNAAMLFDVSLKALAISPNTAGYTDTTLAAVLQKIEPDVVLPMQAIDLALRIGGKETQMALTEFVPDRCLALPDPAVRCQALRVLLRVPGELPRYKNAILSSLSSTDWSAADAYLNMHEYEMALTASPVLAHLAVRCPDVLGPCLAALVNYIKVSIKNSPLSKVDDEVILAINMVAHHLNAQVLVDHVNNAQVLSALPELKKHSSAWAHLIAALKNDGVITSGVIGYSAGPAASASSTINEIVSNKAANTASSMDEALQAGDYMEAARLCHAQRMVDPSAFEGEGSAQLFNQILPGISATLLPSPTMRDGVATFTDSELANYDTTAAVVSELRSLFPSESENVLQLSGLMKRLNEAVVRSFLAKDNPDGARKWLREKNVHSPALLSVIDKHECAQTVSAVQVSAFAAPPPAYSPSATMAPTDPNDVWGKINQFQGGPAAPASLDNNSSSGKSKSKSKSKSKDKSKRRDSEKKALLA